MIMKLRMWVLVTGRSIHRNPLKTYTHTYNEDDVVASAMQIPSPPIVQEYFLMLGELYLKLVCACVLLVC